MSATDKHADAFKNPAPDYRGAPFWAWNSMLDKDEMLRQAQDMLDHGLGGGFMHSRVGLETPYMEEDFMDIVKSVVELGKKNGFKAYLYDEDRWPSGFAGGKVTAKGDEYRQKLLAMIPKADAEQIDGTVLSETNDYIFKECISVPSAWFNGDTYSDNLNKKCVAAFIEHTYEGYKDLVGDEFGKTVPAIFTDEPNIFHGRAKIAGVRLMPWTTEIPERFEKEFGYSILDKLEFLFADGDEAFKVRHDYWKTISDMFVEAWSQQLGEWCQANNLALTGHMLAEQSMQAQIRVGGSVMPHYEFMQIPGIDILRESISENLTVKQTSSVMHQMGRNRMLSELYGCSGWDFSFEGQKWVSDWQQCLGVNLRCQHLTWYTMKGSAKRDYPPCFNYQHPMWDHFNQMEDYAGRISYILSQGEPVIDTLLLHPVRTGWGLLGDGWSEELNRFDNELNKTIDTLLGGHADFDLGDETIIERHGAVSDSGEFIINAMKYKTVIVPACMTIAPKTFELLKDFAAKGGTLIALRPLPVKLGADDSEEVTAFLKEQAIVINNHPMELKDKLQQTNAATLRITAPDGADIEPIIYQQREIDGEMFVFMVNRDRSCGYSGSLSLDIPGGAREWDLKSGEVTGKGAFYTETGIQIPFTMPATGSLMFSIAADAEKVKPLDKAEKAIDMIFLNDEYIQSREHPNGLPVDFCKYRIDGGEWSENMQIIEAHLKICKDLNIFRDVESRWVYTKDLTTVGKQVDIESVFHVTDIPDNVMLAMEEADGAEVTINGKPVPAFEGWYMDRCISKTNIAGLLQKGENTVQMSWDYRDGMQLETYYIIGDFAVDANRSIISESSTLKAGDYCPQGYPYYSGTMVYTQEIDINPQKGSRYILELNDFKGIGVNVTVNGFTAGSMPWPPYELDITEHLTEGINRISLHLIGSPRNLLGPNHIIDTYPAWTGPGQFNVFDGDMYTEDYNIAPHGLEPGVRIAIKK